MKSIALPLFDAQVKDAPPADYAPKRKKTEE